MRFFFLILCAFIVLGGFLVHQMQQGSGYILLVWGETSIEMSVWFGLIALLVIAFVLWLIISILRGSFRGVRTAKQKIMGYNEKKVQQQTTEGLLHFIEGDWELAHKKLIRSAKKTSAPIINYLSAARCAYEMGNGQEALQLLHDAETGSENSALAVALTQARMQLSNQQNEKALATLERASKVKANHPVVLSLKQKVYVALKDWDSLQTLLPKLEQQNIGSVKQRYYLEKTLYDAQLREKITKIDRTASDEGLASLNKYWKKLPSGFQQEVDLLSLYTNELIRCGQYDKAEELLLKGIKNQWSDRLVGLYGLLQTTALEASLKTAETWLNAHPNNSILLLTLGRLCLRNQQWGRAKDFFKQSLSIKTCPEAYAELARLQKYLGEDKDSQDSCRLGLLSSVKSLASIPEFE